MLLRNQGICIAAIKKLPTTRNAPVGVKEGSQALKMPGQPIRPAKVRGAQLPRARAATSDHVRSVAEIQSLRAKISLSGS